MDNHFTYNIEYIRYLFVGIKGAIQVLRKAVGGGGCQLSRKKCYDGVRFNVISVTRGWVGVKFPGKKRYVTLEWPLIPFSFK